MFAMTSGLELVHVAVEAGDLVSETLADTGSSDKGVGLVAVLERVAGHLVPVIEDQLWEGLTSSVRAEIGSETKGFSDWQVGLDLVERSTRAVLFANDLTTASVHHTIDTTHHLFRALNVDQVDRLAQAWLGSVHGSLHGALGWGHDLTSAAVNGIGVKGDIGDVEADAAHVLFAEHTFACGHLEGSANVVLHFVQVLHGLGVIKHNVGAAAVGTEGPDLAGFSSIPAVVFRQVLGADLHVVSHVELASLYTRLLLLHIVSFTLNTRYAFDFLMDTFLNTLLNI